MKKFIEFVKKIHTENYPRLIEKIRDEQIPIATFSSMAMKESISHKAIFIKKLIEDGFNLQYYFTPLDPENDKFPQYPNLKIVNVSQIHKLNQLPKYIFIKSDIFAAAFVDVFKSLGIELIQHDKCADSHYSEFYLEHLPEIFDVYQMLDEESRKVFLAFMFGNVSSRISDYIYDDLPQYFLHGFMPKIGDILIDGGAYDGSSGSMFKKFGCEVFAFELDEENFKIAKARGDREEFVVENFGLGEHSKRIEYLSFDTASHVVTSNADTPNKMIGQLISIDEYVREKNLPRVDFIKMDIEGSELSALKGAALSIARWKPRLAISAYHRPEDIYTLAKFLKSIRPDYEFAFRHYPTSYDNEPDLFGVNGKLFLETFDLPLKVPFIWESILYAR